MLTNILSRFYFFNAIIIKVLKNKIALTLSATIGVTLRVNKDFTNS